jgi:hypothetical protein
LSSLLEQVTGKITDPYNLCLHIAQWYTGLLQVPHQEGWRCIGHFSLPLAYSSQIPSANVEQAQVAKKSIKYGCPIGSQGTLAKYTMFALLLKMKAICFPQVFLCRPIISLPNWLKIIFSWFFLILKVLCKYCMFGKWARTT